MKLKESEREYKEMGLKAKLGLVVFMVGLIVFFFALAYVALLILAWLWMVLTV